jgi:hypothetical protein
VKYFVITEVQRNSLLQYLKGRPWAEVDDGMRFLASLPETIQPSPTTDTNDPVLERMSSGSNSS